VGVAYLHGKPTPAEPAFLECYRSLVRHQARLWRIQVSHTQMRDLVLDAGLHHERVFLIPIGIDIQTFPMRTRVDYERARERLGLPRSAVVVGSFQKDGVGWGEGLEPKLVKGPDVFLATIERLRAHMPELHVLLTGPARGYVKQGLRQLGVPYRHTFFEDKRRVVEAYQALDLYLVTSREEGGPKAVLESMATGVPLVSTRVGQASDLVQHGRNGWLADSEDVDALTHWATLALHQRDELDAVLTCARRTAEANSYTTQLPLWRGFFDGFVEPSIAR
jgi:glycosyltransferase involved in cell wall biosynthesis